MDEWTKDSDTLYKEIDGHMYRIWKDGTQYSITRDGEEIPGRYQTLAVAKLAAHVHAQGPRTMPAPTTPYLALATQITENLVLALRTFAEWYPVHAGLPVLTKLRDDNKNEMRIKQVIDDHLLWIAPEKGAPEE